MDGILQWVINKLDGDANFPSGILFSNVANFFFDGVVNCENPTLLK
jgi:hypothetical protein